MKRDSDPEKLPSLATLQRDLAHATEMERRAYRRYDLCSHKRNETESKYYERRYKLLKRLDKWQHEHVRIVRMINQRIQRASEVQRIIDNIRH